jgi:hypothetical protein
MVDHLAVSLAAWLAPERLICSRQGVDKLPHVLSCGRSGAIGYVGL